jgi:hypothetical protein
VVKAQLTYKKPLDYVYGLSSSVIIPMIPMVLSFDDRPYFIGTRHGERKKEFNITLIEKQFV